MKLIDIVLLAVIVSILLLALRQMFAGKKRGGCSGCCEGCTGCAGRGRGREDGQG